MCNDTRNQTNRLPYLERCMGVGGEDALPIIISTYCVHNRNVRLDEMLHDFFLFVCGGMDDGCLSIKEDNMDFYVVSKVDSMCKEIRLAVEMNGVSPDNLQAAILASYLRCQVEKSEEASHLVYEFEDSFLISVVDNITRFNTTAWVGVECIND